MARSRIWPIVGSRGLIGGGLVRGNGLIVDGRPTDVTEMGGELESAGDAGGDDVDICNPTHGHFIVML
jgi:hypothetical protein